jgi:hypothetical protein
MFNVINQSVFDTQVDAYVNTINCVGVMGAGIALEFKKRYPEMFADYVSKCKTTKIRPGECYVYNDKSGIKILGLAVKDDWRQWGTLEWIEQSLNSMKLVILENDIKSVNLPLPGGKNGRRGPYGPVPRMTPPPEDRMHLIKLVQDILEPFSNKFEITINLCNPSDNPKPKPIKTELTLDKFFDL